MATRFSEIFAFKFKKELKQHQIANTLHLISANFQGPIQTDEFSKYS